MHCRDNTCCATTPSDPILAARPGLVVVPAEDVGDQLRELRDRVRAIATDMKHLVVAAPVVQHEKVGVHDVVDVDEIADLFSILENRRFAAAIRDPGCPPYDNYRPP